MASTLTKLAAALCATLLVTVVGATAASADGPWNEVGDAGDLPATAQVPTGTGAIASITGSVGTNDADMYKICLDGGGTFAAYTIGGIGTATFDTELFLFDANGKGVESNDDFSSGTTRSYLQGADQGNTFAPQAPGVYYLAISGNPKVPQSDTGDIFPDVPPSMIYGPTGPGGALPIQGWTNPANPASGSYTIGLFGANFCGASQPTVSVNNVTQPEGSGDGTTNFAFTISLSAASATPVTVQYYTADISAKAPLDYAAISPTVVTFAPGETTKTVNVAVVANNTPESDKRFAVKLTHPTGAALGTATGIGTIVNDDGAVPAVSINDVTMAEGTGGGTTPFTFTVTLASASAATVTVPYYTADLEAMAPGDYTAIPTTNLVFAPGQTSKTVTVLVNKDATPEPNERFQVRLSPPTNATRAKGVGIGTIVNDD